MNDKLSLFRRTLLTWAVVAGALAAAPLRAQHPLPPPDRAQPVTCQIVNQSTDSRSIDPVGDGRFLLRVKTSARIVGDLSGTFRQQVTQLLGEEDWFTSQTSLWILRTADGTMQGYLSGVFNHLDDGTHDVVLAGRVVDVSPALAKYFGVEVFYHVSLSADHSTAGGTLTFTAPDR